MKATLSAMAAMRMVADKRGSAPKCFSANRGVHTVPVRNDSRDTSPKKGTASESSVTTMPTVVTTESSAHRNRKERTTVSRTLSERRFLRHLSLLLLDPEIVAN